MEPCILPSATFRVLIPLYHNLTVVNLIMRFLTCMHIIYHMIKIYIQEYTVDEGL